MNDGTYTESRIRSLEEAVANMSRILQQVQDQAGENAQNVRVAGGGFGGDGGFGVIRIQVSGGDIAGGGTGTVTAFQTGDTTTATGTAYSALNTLSGTATNLSTGFISMTQFAIWEIISIDCI